MKICFPLTTYNHSLGLVAYLDLLLSLVLLTSFLSRSTAVAASSSSSSGIIMNDCDDGKPHCRRILLPDPAKLENILHASDPFESTEEKETCKRMVVEELTEEEQELAASTSYAYWASVQLSRQPVEDCPISDSDGASVTRKLVVDDLTRIRMAALEARRHLVGQDGDYDSAVERLKNTLEWRKEGKIDLIKTCFSLRAESTIDTSNFYTAVVKLSDDDEAFCTRFEKLVEADQNVQKMAVRGHDKEGSAIIIKQCRQAQWEGGDDADDGYRFSQIYMAERALAVTELRTAGRNEKIAAIFDFGAYDAAHSPPLKIMVDTTKLLQANYPERMGKAILLDAPFWMQAIFKVIQPFLASATREKLAVLSAWSLGNLWPLKGPPAAEVREDTVRAVVDPEQAMPFMLPDAKLVTDINVERQLWRVPFSELYDEFEAVGADQHTVRETAETT